jgi:integrase
MTELMRYGQDPLAVAGAMANQQAEEGKLSRYQELLSPDTLRRQRADLMLFQRYLAEKRNVVLTGLFEDLSEWQGITYGLVEDYKRWQKEEGYALTSVAIRLTTIHVYARLAFEIGHIPLEEYLKIKEVRGDSQRHRQAIDEGRPVNKRRRPNAKRAEPIILSASQCRAIRQALLDKMNFCTKSEYCMAVRDLALFTLLCYQGFRVGEVVRLCRNEVHLDRGLIIVHRHKVRIEQKHELHPLTLSALKMYLEIVKTRILLFEGTDRDPCILNGKTYTGSRAIDGMDEDSVAYRIEKCGLMIGIEGLAPHDLRHSWANDLAENGTPIEVLKEAGGWATYQMPEHYKGKAKIANKGVRQSS